MTYTKNTTPYWVDGTGTTNEHDVPLPETNEEQHGYIYKITNRINGHVYIGEKRLFPGRQQSWRAYLGSGTYLKGEVEAYGVANFSKEFVEWTTSDAHAKLREARHISEALTRGVCLNSNNAYSLRRDPVENAIQFATKASWRSKDRLLTIISELAAMGKAETDLRERLTLKELEDAHRLALNLKKQRFSQTGVLDAKDRPSNDEKETW